MEENNLPLGRIFEKAVFGYTVENHSDFHIDFGFVDIETSIQDVIQHNWEVLAWSMETKDSYVHDPTNPKMGRTKSLWKAVKRLLPQKIDGRRSLPLNLYVAIGDNPLDRIFGIDAFFWWQGVYVTLDASVAPKSKSITEGKLALRADFLISPRSLGEIALCELAGNISNLLIRRRDELVNGIRQSKIVRIRWKDPG